jgi:hypothetical protein
MIVKQFKCDLCQATFMPNDARLVPFKWAGGALGSEIVFVPSAHDTEKHLCGPCLTSLVKLLDKARKSGHAI